jgi:hypothetical protein
LEKNCEGNEKETNGSSMPKRNKVGEEKRKNECGELKKHGLPKSTKPEQKKRDGGRNKKKHTVNKAEEKRNGGSSWIRYIL